MKSPRFSLFLLLLFCSGAGAQTYPNRPIRMIVPFAAGGTTDALGRVLAVFMSEGLGQRLAYNPERDLVPVAMVARSPNIFIVHPSVPVKSAAELIEFSKG